MKVLELGAIKHLRVDKFLSAPCQGAIFYHRSPCCSAAQWAQVQWAPGSGVREQRCGAVATCREQSGQGMSSGSQVQPGALILQEGDKHGEFRQRSLVKETWSSRFLSCSHSRAFPLYTAAPQEGGDGYTASPTYMATRPLFMEYSLGNVMRMPQVLF